MFTSPAGRIRLLSFTVRTTSITESCTGVEFQRIDIDHDLPIAAAERLRHRSAGNAGDLVAHVVLAQDRAARVSFSPCPFSVIRQTGRLDASNLSTTGGSVPGGSRRRSAIARFEIDAEVGARVRARLEIDFDQADAGKRPRLNVVDAAAQA